MNRVFKVILALLLAAAGAPGGAGAAGKNRVTGVELDGRGEARLVRIKTTDKPTFTVFRLSDPMRIVVDISGGDLRELEAPISVEDGVIGQIATRQFAADGFLVGRVIVGFEKDLAYNVQAEGNAVVIRTGNAPNTPIERAIPPPVAPVDRAAAERFAAAKRDADTAAASAAEQRREAERAAEHARAQQSEAERVAKEAERTAAEARRAKAESEAAHRQLAAAAAAQRAELETRARDARTRHEQAERAAQKLAEQQAAAERAALTAEQTRRDAEQTAARAEARHKERVAELKQKAAEAQEKLALAKSEKKAAEQARQLAEAAKREAEQARDKAAAAEAAAERTRGDIAKRLGDIEEREQKTRALHAAAGEKLEAAAARERELNEKNRALEAKNAALEAKGAAIEAKNKELEEKQRTVEASQKKLDLERNRLTDMRQAIERDQKKLEASRAAAKEEADRARVAAEQRRLEEQARALAQNEAQLARDQSRIDQVAAGALPVEALLATEPAKTAVAAANDVRPAAAPRAVLPPTHVRLTGVYRRGKGREAAVLLALDGRTTYEAQRIADPPRLVIDLSDTRRDTPRTTYGVQSPFVRRVRLGDHGSTLRAVLDLSSENTEHEVEVTDEGVLVSMRYTPPTALDPNLDPTEATAPPPDPEPSFAAVRDVRFEGDARAARISIDVGAEAQHRIDDRSSKAWVLELSGATVPKSLERSLDTSAYGSVVRLVSTYQAGDGVVKIVANLAGDAKGKVERKGTLLLWQIDAAQDSGSVLSTAAPQTAGYAAQAVALAESTPAADTAPSKKRISLDLKDADIINVIRLLSEVSGENIITSDEVKGKITLRLRNVPWDKALDTILKTKGYDKVRQNNILRIAPSDVIQKERELELEKRKAQVQVEETVIKIITVNYATASEIIGQLKPMLSARGTVQVDDRTNTIICEDVRSNIDRIVSLTKRLDRQTPQVLIEARIVEASTNYLRNLGIQWGGTGQATTAHGNPTGLGFPANVTASGAADDDATQRGGNSNPSRYAINLPAPIGTGAGGGIGFIFGSAGGSQILNLRLTAMEDNGEGRIISSPRITTLDNRRATISQGVDVPISVVSAAGVNTRFIPARLTLEVTPHVTNDGSVLMKIKTSKNEPDFSRVSDQGDPTILNKEAETEVLVPDGDTTVIGGIYTRTTSEQIQAVPILSQIPVLGWLFKSKRNEENRSELLIFVTPRIVNREASTVQSSSIEAQE